MNSNRVIEVNRTWCNHCSEAFYELRDYELSECPHCNRELGEPDTDGGFEINMEIDSKTGEIKVVKK
jgi:hypothetical protein